MRFRISFGAQLETAEARRRIRGPLCHIEGANRPDVDNHPSLRVGFSEAESFGNSSLGLALIEVSGLFDLVETLVRLDKFASFVYPRSTPRLIERRARSRHSGRLQSVGYFLVGNFKSLLPKIRESMEYAPGPSTERIPQPTIDVIH